MINPLGNRVVVEEIKQKVTNTGFHLSQVERPQSLKCKVLTVGELCYQIRSGDVVLVGQFSATEAKEDMQDETLIISEDDILAVIVPDSAE